MSYSGNYYRPSTFGGFSFFPPVVKWLLIINAAVFILVRFFGSFSFDGTSLTGAFYAYLGLMPLGHGFLPWQLITYQFMHADFWHIFFNMFFGLWMFGMEVEHVWGSKKFLYFYLTCGIVAGVSQLIMAPLLEPGSVVDAWGNGVPTIGASGAIYGVLIAFGMLFPDRYIFLYFLIPVKAKYFIAGIILLGVFSVGGASNVATLAHLGGALAGFLYIVVDRRRMPLSGFFRRVRDTWEARAERREEEPYAPPSEGNVHDIREAHFQEKGHDQVVTQQRIDEILDKISTGGYQSLTEEEKKILFDASKKMN